MHFNAVGADGKIYIPPPSLRTFGTGGFFGGGAAAAGGGGLDGGGAGLAGGTPSTGEL